MEPLLHRSERVECETHGVVACTICIPKRYATIVADPPWRYGKFNSFSSGRSTTSAAAKRNGGSLELSGDAKPLPYQSMPIDEIAGLPVAELASDDAHLYLWTTQRYLFEAPRIARAWGFEPSCTLTWCKPVGGAALGWAFVPTTEFVLFARRGKLEPLSRWRSTWFEASRPYMRGGGGPIHSAKPDTFLDIVEQVSPGPYVELFARRARFGWDYWGDQSLGTAGMAA
jgi:N6-adenosine-specific RNA methylase IME4